MKILSPYREGRDGYMIASVLEVKNEIPTLGTADGSFQPWGSKVKGIGVFLLLVASFCQGQFKHVVIVSQTRPSGRFLLE
jgi:hypothetical protein